MQHPSSPIDLRSDTVTRPSQEMRAAIAAAPVGDDQYGEDPTVNLLQEKIAALLGKEAALWLPSGTMANQVALRALTRPGDDVIVSRESHAAWHETGASAALSKGRGAPGGSLLAGSRELIGRAVRYRRMLGGAMRQVGIFAAAGLYALEHNVARLADDHANARKIGERLASSKRIDIDLRGVPTNILVFTLAARGTPRPHAGVPGAGRRRVGGPLLARKCVG